MYRPPKTDRPTVADQVLNEYVSSLEVTLVNCMVKLCKARSITWDEMVDDLSRRRTGAEDQVPITRKRE